MSMEEGGAFPHAVDVTIVGAAVEVLPSDKLVGGLLDDTVTWVPLDVKITVFVADIVEIIFYISQNNSVVC